MRWDGARGERRPLNHETGLEVLTVRLSEGLPYPEAGGPSMGEPDAGANPADAWGVEVRLAAAGEPLLRVLDLMGVNRMLRLYPSVSAALAGEFAS